MTWREVYLLSFAIGGLWSVVSLLGGLHLFHGHFRGHFHGHAAGHVGGHAGGSGMHRGMGHGGSWTASVLNPSSVAIFLAWFGAGGYLLESHSTLSAAMDLAAACALGLAGVFLLALFFRWMQQHEKPLDPSDYQLPGVLGRVSSPIRPDGVGELIYLRDGSRTPLPARSEDGRPINRGEEVIVTRYEKGIAYVRTWEAMTQNELARGERK